MLNDLMCDREWPVGSRSCKRPCILDAEYDEVEAAFPGKFKNSLNRRAGLHNNIIDLASNVFGYEFDQFRLRLLSGLVALDNGFALLPEKMSKCKFWTRIPLK